MLITVYIIQRGDVLDSEYDKSIGFFDSGVGGLSVLKESYKLMPYENYIYFGDSKNAPYGTKSTESIRELTLKAAQKLASYDVKAMVIACNTATSAAIGKLRKIYDIPVIGIEPALKPAVELSNKGKIIIMATPVTLSERKFKELMDKYSSRADIIRMPCAGLADLVEKGIIKGDIIKDYIKEKMNAYNKNDISAVVIGCTHYSFVREELSLFLGSKVKIFDGAEGTARQLKRTLIKRKLLRNENHEGSISILNSLPGDEMIEMSNKLLKL